MSELRFETLSMPAAALGPDNPLPPLTRVSDVHATPQTDPSIPPEDARYVGYGNAPGCLPYAMQDQYDRTRRTRRFRVAVLENKILRATFLLELGGRLASLYHKPSRRELLERNPVFQPANLAIRNAWFSGGVEWNIGLIGHCPFTCSPLFAARASKPDGTPVLRMYEWERIRCVPFQIDAWLPDRSPVLFVHVRIRNPHPQVTPMYWWSNMAVPETPDTRVLAPADHAYRFGYQGGLVRVPIPVYDSIDRTYSTRTNHSMDFFFRVPDGHRRWVTALNAKGQGLIQTSTERLQGRKLFLWGNSAGGRRWQEFLSIPGRAYLEIQAGLARTQAEHLPMPPQSEWSWLEAYGLMEADAGAVHGSDWNRARQAVEDRLEELIPQRQLDTEYRQTSAFLDTPPSRICQRGSGWGALERIRREESGEPPFGLPGLVFDDASLTTEQRPWLGLLRRGILPKQHPKELPSGWMVQREWQTRIEYSLRKPGGEHWLAWLHLGVMRYYAGDTAAAREAWARSYRLTPTPWAARNLAVSARDENKSGEAADWLVAAMLGRRDLLPLAVECGKQLQETKRPLDWLKLLSLLPPQLRRNGRIRLLECQAALDTGDLDRAERILTQLPVVIDLREGERALSDLWFNLHERRLSAQENIPIDDALRARVRREFPPPPAIDFRMSV